MKQEFIPYEQSLELKQLGFNERCFGYYHTELGKSDVDLVIKETPDRFYHLIRIPEHFEDLAPTYQQAFRWFREKYKLYSFIFCYDEGFGYGAYKEGVTQTNESFATYEEAELACLKKLIEIVKNK